MKRRVNDLLGLGTSLDNSASSFSGLLVGQLVVQLIRGVVSQQSDDAGVFGEVQVDCDGATAGVNRTWDTILASI